MIYEIKQKTIHSIDLVDRRSPDQKLAQKHIEIINTGDLIIRDLGFFDVTVLKLIQNTGAFFFEPTPCMCLCLFKQTPVSCKKMA